MMPEPADNTALREIEAEILAAIRAAEAPSEKGMLLLMYRMNEHMAINTAIARKLDAELTEHRVEFRDHVEDEQRILNQGRGAYRVLSWVFVIAYALMGAAGTAAWGYMGGLGEKVNDLQIKQAMILQKLEIKPSSTKQ